MRIALTVAGYSFFGEGQNVGQCYIVLKDWDQRKTKEASVEAILRRARQKFAALPEARVAFFRPATVREMAKANGFEFELMDLTLRGHEALMEARDIVLSKAAKHPLLANVRSGGLDDVMQYDLHLDVNKAVAHGLDCGSINAAIASYWGGTYVNDFNDRGRTKRVYLQADAPYRMQASDFGRYFVRNNAGKMVPMEVFLTVHESRGAQRLERYQGVPAVKILGEGAPGRSSGEAMQAMEEIAKTLPEGFGFEWTGLAWQEKQAGSKTMLLYAISVATVFLCLAALYESWAIPLAVIAVLPIALVGAVAGVFATNLANDVYFQIGLLAVMGLAAKNSILIIAFARDLQAQGYTYALAARIAVAKRFRPIIMTSVAFILGVLPLAVNTGAGSGAQNAVGITVVCGVLAATIFGLYYTPIFYLLINKISAKFTSGRSITHE